MKQHRLAARDLDLAHRLRQLRYVGPDSPYLPDSPVLTECVPGKGIQMEFDIGCATWRGRGYAANVEAVVNVLRKAGVEITDNGVQLIKPPRR